MLNFQVFLLPLCIECAHCSSWLKTDDKLSDLRACSPEHR